MMIVYLLMFEKQYENGSTEQRFGGSTLAKVAFFIMLGLAALNAVSTLIECGPTVCADPPTSYKLIDELGNNN